MVCSAVPKVCILDFPTELLQIVVSHLDNLSLIQLGLTCKTFNYIALACFFNKNNISPPRGSVFSARGVSPEALWAVRAALWLAPFHTIIFYFEPPFDNLLPDISGLYHLIKWLSEVSFVYFNFFAMDFSVRENVAHRLDLYRWTNALTMLLDMVVEKGCTHLLIQGGGRIKFACDSPKRSISLRDYFTEWTRLPGRAGHDVQSKVPTSSRISTRPKPSSPNKASSIGTSGSREVAQNGLPFLQKLTTLWTTQWLQVATDEQGHGGYGGKGVDELPIGQLSTMATLDSQVEDEQMNASRLSTFSIHSDLLLQPSFIPWTLETISTSRITKLSFDSAHVPTSTWSSLLHAIVLPELEDFEILTDDTLFPGEHSHPRFADLQYFFARHPGIHTLLLKGVEDFQKPPTIEKPILPNISSLMAYSTYIVSFLRMHQLFPDTLLRLKSITISSGDCSLDDAVIYDLFDAALGLLTNFTGKHIALTLRFASGLNVSAWFANHVALGTAKSVLSRLTCVSNLTISARYVVQFATFVKHLPAWLGLFPYLESVNVADFIHELKLREDKEFLEQIMERCPRIIVRVGGKPIPRD